MITTFPNIFVDPNKESKTRLNSSITNPLKLESSKSLDIML